MSFIFADNFCFFSLLVEDLLKATYLQQRQRGNGKSLEHEVVLHIIIGFCSNQLLFVLMRCVQREKLKRRFRIK